VPDPAEEELKGRIEQVGRGRGKAAGGARLKRNMDTALRVALAMNRGNHAQMGQVTLENKHGSAVKAKSARWPG
jgi:hypothetical protein